MKNVAKDIKENCIGIYKITCKGNNQFYIGSSSDIKYRWQVHMSVLRKGCHHSVYMQRSFNKYGEDSFKFEIIHTMEEYDEKLLRIIEFYYINLYKPKFNSGAFSIYSINKEWKDKISESTKKLYTEKGYVNPRLGVGKRYDIYNHLGEQIAHNKTCPEVCNILNYKSYHTLNNAFRQFDGIAVTKDQYIIISVDKSIEDLFYLYKNTRFNYIGPICDLEGNFYRRTSYYKPSNGKSTRCGDFYKEILNTDKLYIKKGDKIFTLPGLCHTVQKCIDEKHLNILET